MSKCLLCFQGDGDNRLFIRDIITFSEDNVFAKWLSRKEILPLKVKDSTVVFETEGKLNLKKRQM